MSLIGLDIGTTGCKAIVFDSRGTVLGQGFREYNIVCGEPAMAEQDAEAVWRLALEALSQAIAASGAKEIVALSVSTQGDAIVPVDSAGAAIGPAILGMDYRSQPQARWCAETFGALELFQRTGMRPHPMNSIVKVLWLREVRPEVFQRAARIVTYADFILSKLGAERSVIDYTMASRTMGFDLRTRHWANDLLNTMGLSPGLFSEPVASGTAVGHLSESLRSELGLTSKVLLVSGGHDQPCAALGAGLTREGLGLISTGTAEVLSTAFQQPALGARMYESYYPCYLHACPGMYFTFALNHVGGLLLKWYRDTFGQPEIADARGNGCDVYALIDERMPDGPSPLMAVPHWNGTGTPWCDVEARGAVIGWTLSSTRHDFAKAILEGLTFELLINLNTMEQAGITVSNLVAAGGGAKSRRWLQLKADILGRPIRTLRCGEAACLGAAILAGTAAGVYSSLDEAVKTCVAFRGEFTPHPEMKSRYAERFSAYPKIYPALKSAGSVT